MRFQKGQIPWNKGTKGVMRRNKTSFKKGHSTWCKGTKGIMKPNSGSFKKGHKKPKNAHKFPKGHKLGWKTGNHMTNKGYVRIYMPKHPFARFNYVLEHRLVMENFLERYLKPSELIHHKNGIKDDNRIENLEIVKKTAHFGKIFCPFCEKEFLIK